LEFLAACRTFIASAPEVFELSLRSIVNLLTAQTGKLPPQGTRFRPPRRSSRANNPENNFEPPLKTFQLEGIEISNFEWKMIFSVLVLPIPPKGPSASHASVGALASLGLGHSHTHWPLAIAISHSHLTLIAPIRLASPWSSLVEGDTTIPLRFPFQQKCRSFLLKQINIPPVKTT